MTKGSAQRTVHTFAGGGCTYDIGVHALDLAREGGHGKRRVVHAGDITGPDILAPAVDRLMASPVASGPRARR